MLVNKAREILEDLLTEGPYYPPDDRREAVKLGIASLHRLIRCRSDQYPDPLAPLPGETT
ncbi:hypothetical protein ES703_79976 [subsurface metagenome]